MSTLECDVAVVGGGILGLAVAAVCAQRGYGVHIFRMGDHGCPRADTLRNQGWLQSGLMYVGHYGPGGDADRKLGRALATRMRVGGLAMLQDLGIPLPNADEYGIFRLSNEEQLHKLLEDATQLRLKNVSRLDQDTARKLLGPAFVEDSIYCTVPDLPFPEAAVVQSLREWAVREGALLSVVDAPIQMVASSNSDSGVLLDCDGTRIISQVTIAVAGAGNLGLLAGLGIKSNMELQQTPLLVVHDTLSITAPIFNDRVQGFSFVRHQKDPTTLPNGALVIATRAQRIVPFAMPEARRIEKQDIDLFASHLPEAFSQLVNTGRFTAGFEVCPSPELKRPHVAPWIHWCPEFPALMHAMPGRATLALSVAREILANIETKIGAPRTPRNVRDNSRSWNDEIYMHFHQHYDFDDWERPRGSN